MNIRDKVGDKPQGEPAPMVAECCIAAFSKRARAASTLSGFRPAARSTDPVSLTLT